MLNMGKKGVNDDSKISILGHGRDGTQNRRRSTDASWERGTDFRFEPTKFDVLVKQQRGRSIHMELKRDQG